MFSFLSKKQSILNIVIDDHVVRLLENRGSDVTAIKVLAERKLPGGLIENGKMVDEMQFYEVMKQLIQEFGLKMRPVRFYVPNALMIMRQVDVPRNVPEDEMVEHFFMEIGETIHLPFEQPLLDVHVHPEAEEGEEAETRKATLFAAPEEEVMKYTNVFEDVSLKPVAIDVQALGVYRYYHYLHTLESSRTYLLFELNLTSTNISIFHQFHLEFLRYHPLDFHVSDWKGKVDEKNMITWEYVGDERAQINIIDDQVNELERLMNFYRYSLYKGEKMVDEIVIYGDHPDVEEVATKVKSMYDVSVTYLDGQLTSSKQDKIGSHFVPALGLALKGGAFDAS